MINISPTTILILLVLFAFLTTETYAFGAGEIPEFAYLHAKAFRHGDIENVLEELAKSVGGAAGGASLMGFAQALLNSGSGGGSKFSHADVKRVYFGNWLRDYSQAMDIAGLSKLTGDTIVLIVSILGFVTFGFATEEYEVTKDRLGVYLPVEHIDNPKGYAEAEGDARQYDRRLRPPVEAEELNIDLETGMKNYMATENRGWDTSTAHIRRVLRECIEHGRRAQGRDGPELFEAYRLLGTGLHTLEDLLAHSNWCELALRKMGHEQVFPHVGENVIIDTPNGPAPPLITGTFGSADFLHSLMGEATDHLSQASVVDLSKNLTNAAENDTDSSLLRGILQKLPIGGADNDQMDQADAMKEQSKAYNFDPDDVMPPEVKQQMLQLLKWRDGIYRDILAKIEMVPGLETLLNAFTDALNAFVYTILAPYLTPILKQVTDVLSEGSKALLDSHEDQYAVFDDPDASDPSHSLLSKDHFALILNEPAGKTALVVVKYAVGLIVNAWSEEREDPDRVIDQILEAFHHPYYNTGRSRIQQDMFNEIERWFRDLDQEEAENILQGLTKESVREGKNKRQGSDDDMGSSAQVYGQTSQSQSQRGAYASGGRSSYGATGQGHGASGGYGQSHGGDDTYSRPSRTEPTGYGRNDSTYSDERQTSSGYGRTNEESYGSSRQQTSGYGEEQPSYGLQARTDEASYGSRSGGYGSSRRDDDESNRYGQSGEDEDRHENRQHHGRRHHEEENNEASGYGGGRGYNPAYTSNVERDTESYGRSSHEASGYAPSYGRQQDTYGGGQGDYDSYGRRTEERSGGYGGDRDRNEYSRGESTYESRASGGYGESGGYNQPQEDSYGRRRGDNDEEGERHHGRRHHNQDNEGDGSDRYGGSGGYGGGYGGGESQVYGGGESRGYGGDRYGDDNRRGYGGGEGGGYGGGEGRGYGGGDDPNTFGAERLNIRDDGEEERPHHGRHHRQEW